MEGGDVVKIAQLANITGSQNRISQPETPVTLQFQGNKFTLSPSQLRQLTTGQPLQLQGKPTNDCRNLFTSFFECESGLSSCPTHLFYYLTISEIIFCVKQYMLPNSPQMLNVLIVKCWCV